MEVSNNNPCVSVVSLTSILQGPGWTGTSTGYVNQPPFEIEGFCNIYTFGGISKKHITNIIVSEKKHVNGNHLLDKIAAIMEFGSGIIVKKQSKAMIATNEERSGGTEYLAACT